MPWAAYLQSFGDEGVPERYGMPKGDGRKSVDRSWNPIELLRSPNWITLVTLLAAAAVLAAAGAAGPGPGPAGNGGGATAAAGRGTGDRMPARASAHQNQDPGGRDRL